MNALTRDMILSAADSMMEAVDVPEWGGTVHVRVMSGAARDRWERRVMADPGENMRASLAVATVCDESGNPLFTEADIPVLGEKSSAALSRIFDVATRINRARKQDIEELAKNS